MRFPRVTIEVEIVATEEEFRTSSRRLAKIVRPKNWNILRPPWNLVRLKNSGMLLIEGKGREMTLCRSENLISGESAQIAQWIADVFFVVSFNKAPSTACSGEENKVVRDCEQFEKNEFMLYSLVELMKIKGLHD